MTPETPAPVPPEQPRARPTTTAKITEFRAEFLGPLPPPQLLEHYERVLPGLADRIVAMAEAQSRHRQGLERRVTWARSRGETLGQILAFVLAMTIVGGSVWLISIGRSIEGVIALVGEIAALSAIFIYGRRSQQRELEGKREELNRTHG